MPQRMSQVLLLLVVWQANALAQRNSHTMSLQFGTAVVGEPFSATRTLDYEPAVGSSEPVAFHAEQKLFRDSVGRTRSEMKYPNQLAIVDIFDPVAHLRYQWTAGDTVVTTFPIKDTAAPIATSSSPEKLDSDAPKIEGIPTRHTHHASGTDTITETDDSWFAPSLHLALLTIIDKPGAGKTTYRFSGITVGEPDPALFRVPPGMTPEDNKTPPPPVVANNTSAEPANASVPSPATPVPEYASDPKFQKALASAKEPRLPMDERLARWKNANKIAKGQCVDCMHQMIICQRSLSQWKDVANTADQLDAIAVAPKEKFFAESERGAALMHSNDDEPKPDQVKAAEVSLRSALSIAPTNSNLLFTEGRALAMLGRDDEAKAMFQKYLETARMADPYRTRVEHFIENPRLAALRMAPAFTLMTSQGEQISLDDMGGKVVLLDFWATWCGPCKETLPEIRRMATKFADQPLVVVSISGDKDANAWTKFVAGNQMTWPQYRDADGALSRAYGVSSIPRFFTIDTDGALQSVKVGSGADIEGDVRKLLNKARDAAKKKAKESDRSAAGE